MQKTPLIDRIENFLIAYPTAKKIPVHPKDYEAAIKLADKHFFGGLKITRLGMFEPA